MNPPSPRAAPRIERPERSDRPTEDARARLVAAGLRLFADQGFAETSTRELAEAAGVNVAAISYYFGDKAGLYRAVFFEPFETPPLDEARLADPALPLPEAMTALMDVFMQPLQQGDAVRQCMKLHFREMLEPTGLWEEELARDIKPMHGALVALLAHHLGLAAPDDDVHRLAFSLAGLGVHMHVGREVFDAVQPGLIDDAAGIARWRERLVMYALAMIEAERARRAGGGGA
jgi:AcrR family transcriptional regulator